MGGSKFLPVLALRKVTHAPGQYLVLYQDVLMTQKSRFQYSLDADGTAENIPRFGFR